MGYNLDDDRQKQLNKGDWDTRLGEEAQEVVGLAFMPYHRGASYKSIQSASEDFTTKQLRGMFAEFKEERDRLNHMLACLSQAEVELRKAALGND